MGRRGSNPRSPRRARPVGPLAVAVAALLAANGTVAAERLLGRDLSEILADALRPDVASPDGTAPAERLAAPLSGSGGSTSTSAPPSLSSLAPPGAPSPVPPTGSRPSAPRPSSSRSPFRPSSGGVPPTPATAPNATTTSTSGIAGTPGTGGGAQPGIPVADDIDTVEEAVAALEPLVESEAGLAFQRPVRVRLLSDAEFSSRLAQLNWLPRGEAAERLEGVYRALGLIGDGVDVATELAKFTRAEVMTHYDAVAGELLARRLEPTPYLRTMLVREMTRALDDQWFDIYRPALDAATDESRDGLKALVEGDASRVQDRYLASLSADERAQVDAERQRIARQAPNDINRSIWVRFTYAVTQGPKLVAALLSAGGRARLDAAFSRPATTSEQVLAPDRYLAGEGAKAVVAPSPDGALESQGVLGHVGLLTMLSEAMDEDTAARAAGGWGGDRYVSWRDGNRTCVRAVIVMDTAQDTTELADALQRWAAARPGAGVSGSGPFTIHRCA